MDQTPNPFAPPSSVSRMFGEARECLARSDYPQAIQILQRAHGLDSTNDKVLIELGYAYAMAYDFAAAERYFENAIRVAPSKALALLAVGHRWMDVRHFEAACNYFERILQQNHVPMAAFVRLGEMYVRLRRVEEAVQIAERAMHSDPTHEGALLTRAKVHRQMRQLDDAERLLRAVVSKSDYPAEARAAAWYELGTVLDQQQRYDEAMQASLEAKALLRLTAAPVIPTLRIKQAQMKHVQETISESMVQRWRKFGSTELQPSRKLALLCGYPRSGTTLLEYVVDSHPEVVSADETAVFQSKAYLWISRNLSPKTPFLPVIDSMPARIARQIRADYFRGIESFLGQPIGNRLLIDKNPSMTYDIPAVSRIFPETKFLVALRDPRDVCLSCFTQAWPVLPDTVPWLTLEGTVDNYASLMGLWLACKPCLGDAAIEVRYEDMVENLESSARRTLDFLGLAWDERVLRFHEHAQTKVVRSPTHAEVVKPIFKSAVGRWRNYQKYFEPHLEKLAPFLRAFGYAE